MQQLTRINGEENHQVIWIRKRKSRSEKGEKQIQIEKKNMEELALIPDARQSASA
jgi:hypothetical protein